MKTTNSPPFRNDRHLKQVNKLNNESFDQEWDYQGWKWLD